MLFDMNKQIDALLNERAGYVRRGLKDRVKACDDSLAALGYKNKTDVVETAPVETASVEPVVERAVRKAAPKRKA
jgi:hypothetical protein